MNKDSWKTELLPYIRFGIPLLSFMILTTRIQPVYFREFHLLIPRPIMLVILSVLLAVVLVKALCFEKGQRMMLELVKSLIPVEAVLFLYYAQYQMDCAIGIVLTIVIAFLFDFQRRKKDVKRMNSVREGFNNERGERIRRNASVERRVISDGSFIVFLIVIMLAYPSIRTLGDYGIHQIREYPANTEREKISDRERLMLENWSVLHYLENDTWAKLTLQERLDILQTVANIETAYLNIDPVQVANINLEHPTVGSYNHTERVANIDLYIDFHADALECVETIAHECRHAYQNDVVDSLAYMDMEVLRGDFFDEAKQWKYELANPIKLTDDRDGYYSQGTETDAREYAEAVRSKYSGDLMIFSLVSGS